MKRTLIGLALALAIAAPAQADSAGYVTRHEYHRVQPGMTKRHAQAIFDTRGTATRTGQRRQDRAYRGWKPTVEVYVRYRLVQRHWRVVQKSAEATQVSP